MKGGVALCFEGLPPVDVTIEIEVVVEQGVGRGVVGLTRPSATAPPTLKLAHPSKSRHRPLPSSERQVAVLSSVVEVTADLLAVLGPDGFHRGPIGSKPVSDDGAGRAASHHRFLQKRQSR